MSKFATHVIATLVLAGSSALLSPTVAQTEIEVSSSEELVLAVNNGSTNDIIRLSAGTFTLSQALKPKTGMSLLGAGQAQTIITASPNFVPESTIIGDQGTYQLDIQDDGLTSLSASRPRFDESAYLISMDDDTTGLTVSNIHFTAPKLPVRAVENVRNAAGEIISTTELFNGQHPIIHGAIWGVRSADLKLENNKFSNFAWSAVRTWAADNIIVSNNTFVDAGGRTNVVEGGTGGAIFGTFTKGLNGEKAIFTNTRFLRSDQANSDYFGIKGRQYRDAVISHNTFKNESFSVELPFENDFAVEMTNNYFGGVVSIPKGGSRTSPQSAGGVLSGTGEGFTIRNNYFSNSYSIEAARLNTLIDGNLFDFAADDDVGNLMIFFASVRSAGYPGQLSFSNNNVRNPGRGIIASSLVVNNAEFSNNHIIADETLPYSIEDGVAPGLFGFRTNRKDFGRLQLLENASTSNQDERNSITTEVGNETITVDFNLNISITVNGAQIPLQDSQFVSILGDDKIHDDGSPDGLLIPAGTIFIDAQQNDFVAISQGAVVDIYEDTEFDSIKITNNIIEIIGDPRPLLRSDESRAGATIENNVFTNIEDSAALSNPSTGAAVGPSNPLSFSVGVDGEYIVDGFEIQSTKIADNDFCVPIRAKSAKLALVCL